MVTNTMPEGNAACLIRPQCNGEWVLEDGNDKDINPLYDDNCDAYPTDNCHNDDEDEDRHHCFTLSNVHTKLGFEVLEEEISIVLQIASDRITVLVDDEEDKNENENEHNKYSTIQFIVYPDSDGSKNTDNNVNSDSGAAEEEIVQAINKFIRQKERNKAAESRTVDWWLGPNAECCVAEMEEEVLIDEMDALTLWREMADEVRTSHLEAIPDPDGKLVVPAHNQTAEIRKQRRQESATNGCLSPTRAQLLRDPDLLDFDNVARVEASQLDTLSWTEPVIITDVVPDSWKAQAALNR